MSAGWRSRSCDKRDLTLALTAFGEWIQRFVAGKLIWKLLNHTSEGDLSFKWICSWLSN
jgi:hypothetical protein